jgi:hypothetical protein
MIDKLKELYCYLFGHKKSNPRRGDGKIRCHRCYLTLVNGMYEHLPKEEQLNKFCEREMSL